MRSTASYIRIITFLFLAYLLIELTVESGEQSAFIAQPLTWLVLGMVLLFIIAIEISLEALRSILFRSLKPDAQERYILAEKAKKEKQFKWIKSIYLKLLDSKPVESEEEIILDHNYDGIKELDNNLPPWWVYMFYATIIFGIVYLVRFHVYNDYTQAEEYETEVAEAKIAIEKYKKTAKDLVDVNTVTLLTDASDINAGKAVYTTNCVACHKADGGGGIGPNLTDEYWILGGGIKNVFRTISEGGRDGKGMVAWKQTLKPVEMAQVASYIITLGGTTPAEPKEAQGEIWTDPDAQK
ncbi:cytochrome c oxidase cbb3-type subunit 3 [Aquimarina sp. EL_43]|uniref:cbb3-type cytochrome c oxidase N-terminal domain-containing protein n=1 Tax=Aquimarina TaxID=290174 RepID=UPI0004729146|nr:MULTISPECIES: cbb3-type cytochrome c oxidase N-terminal domain-containing protein [Aquimarina]MBG6131856.1 cytochrome c oxidase cbb3-type subunit 3 [Aquimarina sp. EL_35]MBG6149420.1 cytochrome c oxidase cbb3-type subunit 3 [Aquimarina sp. EL_32]MBG6170317.1 cytochrome c oxidase cbb3-type subunit 3 [Aquimarina sp. EL_43]